MSLLRLFLGSPQSVGPRFHESNGPIDASSESLPEQQLGDVALGMDDGADEIGVVDRFEDDLHLPLEETHLDEVPRLFGVLHLDGGIRLAGGVQFETGTLNR